MASAIRRASADLDGDALSRFRSAPWRFDVWQAGAILEAWKGRMDWGVPASDIIPAGVVRGVAFPEGGAPRLDVNLLGLAGMDGPLPPHVALLVRERMRAGDPAFQEFLDLFHNRILHLWRDMASSLCPGRPFFTTVAPAARERVELAVCGSLVNQKREQTVEC